jgi:hypothetical protein
MQLVNISIMTVQPMFVPILVMTKIQWLGVVQVHPNPMFYSKWTIFRLADYPD